MRICLPIQGRLHHPTFLCFGPGRPMGSLETFQCRMMRESLVTSGGPLPQIRKPQTYFSYL
uniref:Uncharacterized protein n=1 Tax=Picea glauca TaxID=3330 RepID=A0A101M2E2_PICGL|nr:hypothetical protein ABT39_MTgene3028 [Picea glauca]